MRTNEPAEEPTEAGKVHGFSVSFNFPVYFTRGVWDPANRLFADTVCRLELERRHRVMVIVDEHVGEANPRLRSDIAEYFEVHEESLSLVGPPIPVIGGEEAKNDPRHLTSLLAQMNDAGLDRHSFVAALGGGAVLDVASFAAAIAHRGIRTIRMPTTVLSQADSGVAVKNGVNMFAKKNFTGTFAPPFAVINDFDFLATLDRRERVAGLSEAVKVSLLRDAAFFDEIEAHAPDLADGDPDVLAKVVRRSAELHLAHICGSGDPFELGSARPLDFGHWAAHKLEMLTSNRLRHGEAVAIGMALDVLYAVRLGYLHRGDADRILSLLETIGFRLWDDALLAARGDSLELLSGLREFQEHLGGELTITMIGAVGRSFEVTTMREASIVESIYELAARAQRQQKIASRAAAGE